jgi:hypothetical protein
MSSYKGHWLPGDGRGFHSRKHRIHSFYYYKMMTPTDEHKGLREYAQRISKGKVSLTFVQRQQLANEMAAKLAEIRIPAAIIACAPTHCHAVIKPGDLDAKPIFGRAKQAGSHALRPEVPGSVWGASSGVLRIRGFLHFASAFWYIKEHVEQGAALWWDPAVERECERHHPPARQAERLAKLKEMLGEIDTSGDR